MTERTIYFLQSKTRICHMLTTRKQVKFYSRASSFRHAAQPQTLRCSTAVVNRDPCRILPGELDRQVSSRTPYRSGLAASTDLVRAAQAHGHRLPSLVLHCIVSPTGCAAQEASGSALGCPMAPCRDLSPFIFVLHAHWQQFFRSDRNLSCMQG